MILSGYMQKNRGIKMQKEDIEHLNQLISSLVESLNKLEIYYEKKEYENFDKLRKFIVGIYEQISEITK